MAKGTTTKPSRKKTLHTPTEDQLICDGNNELTETTVIIANGNGKYTKHPGNKEFKQDCLDKYKAYDSANKNVKNAIVEEMYEKYKCLFFVYNLTDGKYEPWFKDEAEKSRMDQYKGKIKDAMKKIRKELSKEAPPNTDNSNTNHDANPKDTTNRHNNGTFAGNSNIGRLCIHHVFFKLRFILLFIVAHSSLFVCFYFIVIIKLIQFYVW